MSYVRKGTRLNTAQLQPCTSRDLIFLQIQAWNTLPLNIMNIYNAPIGSTNAGSAVDLLIELPWTLWWSAFLVGDFNLHHPNWDPAHPSPSSQAEPFIVWLDNHNFAFTSEVSEPTQNYGNTLDLAFLTGPLSAITMKSEHMDTTLDHSPLIMTVNWSSQGQEPIKRLRPDTIDKEQFADLLQNFLADIPALTDALSIEELNTTAINLTKAISKAY